MKIANARIVAVIVLTISLTMSFSVIISDVYAHQPPITVATFVRASVAPNPVGVSQTTTITVWNTMVPPDAMTNNTIRWTFMVNITSPSNVTNLFGPFTSDINGVASFSFTPDVVGNWTLTAIFPATVYNWSGSTNQRLYTGDTFLTSNFATSFSVQQEPVTQAPIPPEYPSVKPSDWFQITSNWLGTGSPQIYGYMPGYSQVSGMIQPMVADNTTGSMTPHVMWTKPLENGGVVGGNNVGVPGDTFYMGLAYQERFFNIFIVDGKLYYRSPLGETGQSSGYNIVDLRNGQTLTTSSVTSLNAGYSKNGVTVLFGASNFGTPYDPSTLKALTWSLSGVPSGSSVMDSSGNTLREVITNVNTTQNPVYNVLQWNACRVIVPGMSGAVAAGGSDKYDFNQTITYQGLPMRQSPGTIIGVYPGDCLITTNMSTASAGVTANDSYYFMAISLNPSTLGQITFNKTYVALNIIIPGTVIGLCGIDPLNHVIMVYDCNTIQYMGYNYVTGETWGPSNPHEASFDYYAYAPGYFTNAWNCFSVFKGHLYESSYGGILYCYDTKDGSTTWTYGNGGLGNSTNSGFDTVYGSYPAYICGFTKQDGGVIYTFVSEHSPNTPLYKGAMVRCINATSGKELWKLPCFSGLFGISGSEFMVANDFTVYLDCYDQQIYALAKGPSTTTVTVSSDRVDPGGNVLLSGNVLDAAAGTNQSEQAARFPNGVPCVCDDNMSSWMEYIYMHHEPRPNVLGVDVTLTAIASDGIITDIGTTTTDSSGFYTQVWQPPTTGQYSIVANFAGTKAYHPSAAQTSLNVSLPNLSAITPSPEPTGISDTNFMVSQAAIMALIALIGVASMLMLRKARRGS